jgi:DNA mismatch repair protein MutL
MGKIAVLPDALCNQIAAGEVVERPAAVVKELLENSLDAGSRKISITLLQGGRKEIRVVDNGCGMRPDDALLAIERHATSKIRSLDDLQSVRSLGFRGEALPSIASVSRFELISREPEALSGTCIRMEGGILRDVREAGCAAGTAITVRDLFHNVPARRKFLRSVETEMANISDQLMKLALSQPSVHFQMSHENRLVFDFPRTGSLFERVRQVLGAELAETLNYFAVIEAPIELRGFAAQPRVQKSNSRSMFIYVNGRPVWDRILNQSVLRAYDTLLPKGKYPVVVLFLDMPPELVDVNVHPTKREIRLHSPGQVMETIQRAVRKALAGSPHGGAAYGSGRLAGVNDETPRKPAQAIRELQVELEKSPERNILQNEIEPPRQTVFPTGYAAALQVEKDADREAEKPAHDRIFFSRLPILGQLANTYILLEAPDGLLMIDQHAAHERILYDRLSSSSPGETGRQRLTRSLVMELPPREAAILRNWLESLLNAGFEIEPFGPHSFILQATPAALGDTPADTLLREVLETAEEEQRSPHWDLLAGLAKTAACHSAIRAGQKLQRTEILHLLEAMDRSAIAMTCPHGRPLWCKLTHAEIARFFNRT